MSVTITDLFCGAGGSSLGAELAGGTLRLALNHWDRAVETHATNFQHADHDCEDVASLTTSQIRRYPDSDILLASPECTNHSLAKGARRRKPQKASLFDDGPAGDEAAERSRATMWDVVRFAEQKILKGRPYKAIIVENVIDAFKWGPDDNGELFNAWLIALRALEYEHEIVWLNSMFAGWVPQSRNRMYVVLTRKGMRRPNLRFEPIAWCPTCQGLCYGRQTWKRPTGRLWGSYGPQYFYSCSLGHPCIPGAPPAAEAIDWAQPIQTIGERAPVKCKTCGKKHPIACTTRKRVKEGVERLAREPFAIRLTKRGLPKTLTLPLTTITTTAKLGMVIPVGGNRHERTVASRADRVVTAPARAIHGTADRALIVPPMGGVPLTDAALGPAPTQTTTTRAALVQVQHDKPRRARDLEAEQMPTLTGKLGEAIVIANRAGARGRDPDTDQAPTVCTGEGLAFVMRNNNARGDTGQMATPPHEPIRTLTSNGHQSLVIPMVQHTRPPIADRDPVSTLRAKGGSLALLVPYQSEALVAGESPAPTITTHDRAALVMSDDDIDACGFRMFELHEIAAAMAMTLHTTGEPYVVLGNKAERMAQYGNAVTPPAMELLVTRVLEVL